MTPRLDTTVPALILKLGRYPTHHGILGIIRSLGRLRVPVYSVIEDRFTPASVSRYLTRGFPWKTAGIRPYPGCDANTRMPQP